MSDGPDRAGAAAGGRLVLAATPIGDVADAPPRLLRLLATADVVAAEDTRRLRRLCSAAGVTPSGRVVRHDEQTEDRRAGELVAAALGGATVLVVTDAGMPGVSDPGLRVVRAAVAAGVPVTAVPGPSAVLTALALSGLATDRFCFEGFLPRRDGERRRAVQALAREPRTLVLFEAPHRLARTLAVLAQEFGAERPAAVCRELTKTYEEVLRRPLGELADWAAGHQVLGEITLVVAGAPPAPVGEDDVQRLVARVRELADGGSRLKDAVAQVAPGSGVGKRDLYQAALRAGRGTSRPGPGVPSGSAPNPQHPLPPGPNG